VDIGLLFDGVIGAVIGAVVTGTAQIWSFRMGNKTARASLSLNAARELFEVVHEAKDTLGLLPYTESPAGSPLSYGERLSTARPMLKALERAQFVTIPLLTDHEVARRFIQFARYCDHVSGPKVDAQDIPRAVREVAAYGDHVGECLDAHINGKPLPTGPRLDIPALS
jgi:hypothetical protein